MYCFKCGILFTINYHIFNQNNITNMILYLSSSRVTATQTFKCIIQFIKFNNAVKYYMMMDVKLLYRVD